LAPGIAEWLDRLFRDHAVRRAGHGDLQEAHVRAVVVEVMGDARWHVDEVTGLDECWLALIHEACSAALHVDHMKAEFMAMPTGAVFRRLVGADQVDVEAVARCLSDARVRVAGEVAQTRLGPDHIATLGVVESVHRPRPVEPGRIFGRED
jgi:hypothetical protein